MFESNSRSKNPFGITKSNKGNPFGMTKSNKSDPFGITKTKKRSSSTTKTASKAKSISNKGTSFSNFFGGKKEGTFEQFAKACLPTKADKDRRIKLINQMIMHVKTAQLHVGKLSAKCSVNKYSIACKKRSVTRSRKSRR